MKRKPKPLSKGSKVLVVAPSSPFVPDQLSLGLNVLIEMGLMPVYSEHVFGNEGYLAGPDSARLQDLVAAFSSEDGEAVMAVRGGYGSMRLLQGLSRHQSEIRTKLLMGFSDITAIHLFMLTGPGIVTFHGPNVISMARLDEESIKRVRAALFGLDQESTFAYVGLKPLFPGRAEGRILACNLSLLSAMIGTPWEAPLLGAILVLEDINEPLYRIDRMLTQVSLQPDFAHVAGLVFGDMGVAEEEYASLQAFLQSFAEKVRKPAVMGFPIGHKEKNFPVPQGVEALLDADSGTLKVVETPYGMG